MGRSRWSRRSEPAQGQLVTVVLNLQADLVLLSPPSYPDWTGPDRTGPVGGGCGENVVLNSQLIGVVWGWQTGAKQRANQLSQVPFSKTGKARCAEAFRAFSRHISSCRSGNLGGGFNGGSREEGWWTGCPFSTHFTTTLLLYGSPRTDVCRSRFSPPREPVSPSHEHAGATLTGTHWCDDEINLPLSLPTTHVYH